jgi:hypothetical protein
MSAQTRTERADKQHYSSTVALSHTRTCNVHTKLTPFCRRLLLQVVVIVYQYIYMYDLLCVLCVADAICMCHDTAVLAAALASCMHSSSSAVPEEALYASVLICNTCDQSRFALRS